MTDKIVQFVLKPRGRPQSQPTPLEAARVAIIDRVARAIWNADGEDTQPWPDFGEFMANAYEVGDPAMLEQVSDAYRRARAAIKAMKPELGDRAIAERVVVEGCPDNPGGAAWVVDQWIDQVLK